jgi:putrescine aminotransferase
MATKTHNLRTTADWRALDAAHHLHPFTDTKGLNAQGARVIVRADGIHIWDSDGNRIIDGMSGLWNVNVGHARAEIIDAIATQLSTLDYYNTFFKTTHPAVAELAHELATLTPPGLSRSFFTGSGSEANDTIIRMVRHFWAVQDKPEKHIFISRKNAYHGSTIGGASLGGMAWMHKQGGLPIPGIIHVDQPYWWAEGGDMSPDEFGLWAADQVAQAIDRAGADKVAAFIGEPIQGAGGVIVPPGSYWPAVQKICRERDVLIVSDEVICGFGRTGHWFGCQHFGVQPDIMATAKGITSGYFPLGAVIVGDRVADMLTEHGGEFAHGYTYSGHPGACAAALANLAILRRENLVAHVRIDAGPYLQAAWWGFADHPLVGEARMVGLIGALELTPDKSARVPFPGDGKAGAICRDIAFGQGLVMRAVRDTMILAPPLVVTHAEIDEIVAKVAMILDLTQAELRRQGLL